MQSNSYQILLNELKETGKLRNNWYLVASLTEKIKRDPTGPRQQFKRVKDASAASGYSMNTLNRMLAVKEFFVSIKEGVGLLEGIDANTLSFPSLEVVKRLHKVNPDEGIRMLIAVATGKIIFRELREFYNKVVSENTVVASAHQVARLETRDFEEAAMNAVKRASAKLISNLGNVTIEKPRDGRLPIDAMAYAGGPAPVSGFQFVLLRDPENPKQTLENMLYRILFYSSFFSSYWVVFASNTGEGRIYAFINILEKLGYHTIGVAELPWSADRQPSNINVELKLRRLPRATPPNPDHRSAMSLIGDLRFSLIQPIASADIHNFGTAVPITGFEG